MVRYPLGVQNFEDLITEGFVYVDKTRYVYDLTHGNSKYIFLSRPRRFGKTLLTTTLKAYFEGKKELFKGLAIEQLEKDWTKHPVIHLSLNGFKGADKVQLEKELDALLYDYEKVYGFHDREETLSTRFRKLIETAHQTTGQKAVVLIDEYDAPLLDVVHEEENLPALRKIMRNFYAPLKKSEEHLRFVFLTGITKFSQLSIFSELNNIKNMSMDPHFAALCGITEEELRSNFGEGIESLAANYGFSQTEALDKLREMYDGYRFAWPSPGIYNPYSLLNALSDKRLSAYWFASGTPTYLIEMLRKYGIGAIRLGSPLRAAAGSFDRPTEQMTSATPLLYQSGYLTIKDCNLLSEMYTLGIPNNEVRVGLMESLLPGYVGPRQAEDGSNTVVEMASALFENNMDQALRHLKTFLGTIPQTDNTRYEGHWQQVLYIIFSMLGYKMDVEVRTSTGRVDLVMHTPHALYLIEIKLNSDPATALNQIKLKDYPARFALTGKPLTLVGIHFSLEQRNLSSWVIEPA